MQLPGFSAKPAKGTAQPMVQGIALTACAVLLGGCVSRVWNVELADDYQGVVHELSRCVKQEMAIKDIPAMSIALMDGDRVVWAQGFGLANPQADPQTQQRATADTVYRVASISKLFTDVALMRCVERGELDLDAPITQYLPDFQPQSSFDTPITLRHLTSHTSGLLREPPLGNYFETSAPSLADTVQSLSSTQLLFEPGTRTKYSNAGLAVVGRVLEVQQGCAYPEIMSKEVMQPLGIDDSSTFGQCPIVHPRLAKGQMWTYDGRRFPAPTFELGMCPAASLCASVLDLCTFTQGVFGLLPSSPALLQKSTREQMLTPFLSPDGTQMPVGVGFYLDEIEGHRRCGHNGALYGFSTQLSFLPDEGIGVVVAASLDSCNEVTYRLATHALRLMLAARGGRALPRLPESRVLSSARAKRLVGLFDLDGRRIRLRLDGQRLLLEARGRICEVRNVGGHYLTDDKHGFGMRIERIDDQRIAVDGVPYQRIDEDLAPSTCPPDLEEYVGEYGWDHNTLYIRESQGHLQALIEWFWIDDLTEVGPDQFSLPRKGGLYPGESIRFRRDSAGAISHLALGEVKFPRRPSATQNGETFRITPQFDQAHLRLLATAATPPLESGKLPSDLVDLTTVDARIRLDMRYATDNNFMGMTFYPQARALLQRPAAEALGRAARIFAEKGYGILVYDAYRPWHVTKMFWDATPNEFKNYVADPTKGSRHNRGCAVDITLYDLKSGQPVTTTSGYDEFQPCAHPLYPGGTARQRWYRDTLREVMEDVGFRSYAWEWWHFDFDGWREYPIMDDPLVSVTAED